MLETIMIWCLEITLFFKQDVMDLILRSEYMKKNICSEIQISSMDFRL